MSNKLRLLKEVLMRNIKDACLIKRIGSKRHEKKYRERNICNSLYDDRTDTACRDVRRENRYDNRKPCSVRMAFADRRRLFQRKFSAGGGDLL